MSVIQKNHLEIFRQSLQRVTASEAFFDRFYDNFISQSEEIAAFFQNRDMLQLKKKLRETLHMLAESAEGRPGLGLYIEMLGRIHHRLNVQRRHFTMWEEALLDAVKTYDEEFSDQVLSAWLDVIDRVIDSMFAALNDAKKLAS
ncbi:MAG: globin [Candidatus Thiodiazotropha sp.]|nr:globin [Candidatus Thiodiazotropha sp.]MCU7802055.1 globin [Candidatus Thiodiazotropha sp. (ex Lucinoma borealis)]MCU7838373.1 globin [Candidatus Thiodiazotropha sp. (ex Troendleina suluensis)]MCU7882928.1 globin [Candidatus Thiodiazotropha sp. (ex Lucinoma annulata)]MCM8885259.1 globin [Candidatus Thiodiazotropha sp.]